MRFIVSLALLILLVNVAGNGSVCAGRPTSQDTPSGGDKPSLSAPSLGSRQDLSSAADVSNAEVPQGEHSAVAGKPDLHRTTHVITDAEIERAIRAAFDQPQLELRLELMAHSREVLSAGEAEFPLSGASKPPPLHPESAVLWRGYWRTSDGRSTPIWARVRALCVRPVVRLRADVPGGTPLASSVLEQVSVLDSAFRTDPPETLADYEGKILRHFAKAGSVISLKQTADAPLVPRNTMVPVDVISGSLHLRLQARAETDGQAGKSIRLLIPGGRRQFLATIQSDGTAVLNVALEGPGKTASPRPGVRNDL
jgi:flagella basal body P-ring formation protein FlgA